MCENNELTPIWIVNCMETHYPSLWPRWFRNQCVAVGWPPNDGYTLEGPHCAPGWRNARNALGRMRVGDRVAVALGDRRIGRFGEITGIRVGDDEWNPLVPVGPELPYGEMGRRIHVRWDLITRPPDFDLVVQLPREMRMFGPQTVFQRLILFDNVVGAMNDPANWVRPGGRFQRESVL